MTNKEMAAALHDLAAVYESDEQLKQPYELEPESCGMVIFCHNPQDWHHAVRAFGAGEKSADHNSLIFHPQAFPFLRINGFKHAVCERVVVGSRLIPEMVVPAVPEQTIPEHEEEIVEYRCRPFTEPAAPSAEKAEEAEVVF